MYEDVRYETDEGIATITIDRPEVYDAFRRQTILELNASLRDAAENEGVYAVVLTGAGDAFCAGADVNDMPNWHEEMTKEEYAGYLWGVQNVVRQLRNMATPSVAAVGGPAIGAGCDFALACDARVVGPEAVLREGFVRVGLIPGDGGGGCSRDSSASRRPRSTCSPVATSRPRTPWTWASRSRSPTTR